LKEIGGAKKIQSKVETKIDNKGEQPKKKKDAAESHAVAMNTEHSELLGFKTGFKTFAERKPLDPNAPPKERTQAQTQAPAQEGVQQPELKEVHPPAPEETVKQAEGEQKQGGGRGGYGDKGPRKYNPNWKNERREPRDNRDNRDQREPRKDNKPPNFEDDRAFPKLS